MTTDAGERSRWRSLKSGERGFLLIELLVTMIFLGVISLAFSVLVSSLLTHSAEITNESVLQTQVRAAVAELTADLRQAYPPTATATSPFLVTGALSPTALTFYSPDGASTFHLRQISYQLSAGNFQRAAATSSNTNGPPWTIPSLGSWVTRVGSVVNTDVFTYYDASNPPVVTTDPAQVATVVVKLTVATATGHGLQYTYSDSATLRVSQ